MTQWGIDTLFNPGKRHMDEEKRRLQSTREEVGDASGGRRVDFTAGTVRIPRTSGAAGEEQGDADQTGTDERAEDEAAGDETPRARALRRRAAAKQASDADG